MKCQSYQTPEEKQLSQQGKILKCSEKNAPQTDTTTTASVDKAIETFMKSVNLKRHTVPNDPFLLHWQLELFQILVKPPQKNDKVLWYSDKRGGSGKTLIADWLAYNVDCVRFNEDHNDVLKYDGHRIVVFDFNARVDDDFIQNIKSGIGYNQYNLKVLHPVPHVVVFSNSEPDVLQDYNVKVLKDVNVAASTPVRASAMLSN